jgi:hypothetical protein
LDDIHARIRETTASGVDPQIGDRKDREVIDVALVVETFTDPDDATCFCKPTQTLASGLPV